MSNDRDLSNYTIAIATLAITVIAVQASNLVADDSVKSLVPASSQWEQHDLNRPKPALQDPGPGTEKEFAKPPEGAVVLFNGKDLSDWVRRPGAKEQPPVMEPKWKIGEGFFEVTPNGGNIYSKEKFGDCRIHLEWATPAQFKPTANGQNRGNSGVFLPGHLEHQILDSFDNETYADGQAGAVYGKYPPMVNVSRKPGEWQSYDITLEQPRFDTNHKMTRPCTLTVFHNGVLVQDHVPIGGNSTSGTLGLQDHYTPVRFRNVWIQKITPPQAPAPSEFAKKVKVFILAGQSNMEGQGIIAADPKRNGGKGSLEYLVKEPHTAARFSRLVDKEGKWVVRDDVWISYLDRQGPLTVGYGPKQDRIGPELGFGWEVGNAYQQPVLLIKCAWGGKSLAVDFRPPSSGKIPYSLGEKQDAEIATDPNIVGKYYREILTLTKAALARVKELVPGSDGDYEIAGFGWHQGWNDRINDKFNAEYETNMANFIRDIRKELGVDNLPFVIAETGMSGLEEKHPRALSLMKAQAAVAEQPNFKGTVAFVGTKGFWRPQEESPSGQAYHWNTNAETYYLIGESMGQAMKKLLE